MYKIMKLHLCVSANELHLHVSYVFLCAGVFSLSAYTIIHALKTYEPLPDNDHSPH